MAILTESGQKLQNQKNLKTKNLKNYLRLIFLNYRICVTQEKNLMKAKFISLLYNLSLGIEHLKKVFFDK